VAGIPMKNSPPEVFSWYEGYDKKFPTWQSQFLNMINPKRIFSLFKVVL
jgi:hypothetical protein